MRQPARAVACGRGVGDLAATAAATGTDLAALERLWVPLAGYARAVRRRFADHGGRRLALPMTWSRFCSACLVASANRWQVAWRLPWVTACPQHRTLLVDTCPACGGRQRVRASVVERPATAAGCDNAAAGRRRGVCCGHDLGALPSSSMEVEPALALEEALRPALDPAATEAAQADAVDVLADTLLIAGRLDEAFRLRAGTTAPASELASTLAAAWHIQAGSDPLQLERLVAEDARHHGVLPRAWSGASPSLVARVVGVRDRSMVPLDRLRWRSTSVPRRPNGDEAERAKRRARWVPEVLWGDWSLRLTPATGIDATSFRVAAAAALVAPGAPRPFGAVLTALGVFVHPFRSNPYTDSGVFVHPLGRPA